MPPRRLLFSRLEGGKRSFPTRMRCVHLRGSQPGFLESYNIYNRSDNSKRRKKKGTCSGARTTSRTRCPGRQRAQGGRAGAGGQQGAAAGRPSQASSLRPSAVSHISSLHQAATQSSGFIKCDSLYQWASRIRSPHRRSGVAVPAGSRQTPGWSHLSESRQDR